MVAAGTPVVELGEGDTAVVVAGAVVVTTGAAVRGVAAAVVVVGAAVVVAAAVVGTAVVNVGVVGGLVVTAGAAVVAAGAAVVAAVLAGTAVVATAAAVGPAVMVGTALVVAGVAGTAVVTGATVALAAGQVPAWLRKLQQDSGDWQVISDPLVQHLPCPTQSISYEEVPLLLTVVILAALMTKNLKTLPLVTGVLPYVRVRLCHPGAILMGTQYCTKPAVGVLALVEL